MLISGHNLHVVTIEAAMKITGDTQHRAEYVTVDTSSQRSSVAKPPPFPPPQPQIGSPLMWIGVGVGISIVFSWVARKVQGYAMQQAFKSMMQQSGQAGNPFATGPGSNPFVGMPSPNPFPMGMRNSPLSGMQQAGQVTTPTQVYEPPASSATVDVTPQAVSASETEAQVATNGPVEPKKPAFTDVDVSLLAKEEPQLRADSSQHPAYQTSSSTGPEMADGAAGFSASNGFDTQSGSAGNGGKGKSFISLEMLETMLDDPKIQQMVFPYLPAEMRDPVTFKQMIQLPQVRQQLQEALNNMGGEDGLDMLKYMNSDAVKQQFEQIGMTPEEMVGKILASPDIAASLQNPKVVEAIMDCSQNPLNITKYQNDKEVMNALMKIAELFPGATGSPY
ncbi:hypothetical protein KP509_35G014600 [Ceratopteris richardii]|uniref:Protein TIC 40, chloroplastic n=1 Tax=Ceratopteris richardii TaxID=49495 RepID=A0A8T2QEQ2_CERRI|nr:hypothetical protein KP509_35G014600 [Ceratopteris richardii]